MYINKSANACPWLFAFFLVVFTGLGLTVCNVQLAHHFSKCAKIS